MKSEKFWVFLSIASACLGLLFFALISFLFFAQEGGKINLISGLVMVACAVSVLVVVGRNFSWGIKKENRPPIFFYNICFFVVFSMYSIRSFPSVRELFFEETPSSFKYELIVVSFFLFTVLVALANLWNVTRYFLKRRRMKRISRVYIPEEYRC